MNPPSPRWSERLIDAVRAGMLLSGSTILLEAAWAVIVRRVGMDPVPAQLVGGLIAFLVTVLVVQYAYRNAPLGARSMAARGVVTIVMAAIWSVIVLFLARHFSEGLRPFIAVGIGAVLSIFGRWPKGQTTNALRFGQDPLGASALVAPLLLISSAALIWRSHPTNIKVVWHSLLTAQTSAAQGMGWFVGATLPPFIFAVFVTVWKRRDATWPTVLAACPALGSTLLGRFLPAGPALYPQSLRMEEQAASIASQWWHGSQMTAAGFYMSTFLLLLAGAYSAIAASREATREEPSRRQTVIAVLGPIFVVMITGVWLQVLPFKVNLAVQYEMVLLPAAVALLGLSIVHAAGGAKTKGPLSLAACLAAVLAMFLMAIAQALPAGSNADVLDLSPFEWVVASEHLAPKQWSWFSPAISYLAPMALMTWIALRGLSFSWKNVLAPVAPGVTLLAIGIAIASSTTRRQQDELTRAFRGHVPADVTLASGPPASLASCTDLGVDRILFVGREHVTLNGQTIAATRDLDSPQTCATIAERVKAPIPRLAMDETISFRQTTCLLDAFARREPRVCRVMFVGRCKAGTHINGEEDEEGFTCTEHMQANVPYCSEQRLDVDGCPAADSRGPFVVLSPRYLHMVGADEHAPNPWPEKPIDENGRWQDIKIPRYYSATLAVTPDTSMNGFMALALRRSAFHSRLQPALTPAAELPKAPEVANPLGVRIGFRVTTDTAEAKAVVEPLLKPHKNDLRRCLEPQDLPWMFAGGQVHTLIRENGELAGIWPMRHPDDRFGGCIAKIFAPLRATPLQQPSLAEIDVTAVANLPTLTVGADYKRDGIKLDPPNDNLRSDVSYWPSTIGRMLEGFYPNRISNMKCLMPALLRNTKPSGRIDFDVFVDNNDTRVKARSKDIDNDIVSCLEKNVLQQTSLYFQRRLQYLPMGFSYYGITKAPHITIDMEMIMRIEVPKFVELDSPNGTP